MRTVFLDIDFYLFFNIIYIKIDKINQLLSISQSDNLESETLKHARMLEGTLRNTGIHACGVIITPDDIKNFVPIATAKDSDLFVTQFDNAVVEQAGLLKTSKD